MGSISWPFAERKLPVTAFTYWALFGWYAARRGPGAGAMTALDDAEAGPVPRAFMAVAVNVYEVPSVKPYTRSGLRLLVVVAPPGLAVAPYPVMAVPPSLAGGST